MISVGECIVFALAFGASAATPGPETAALLARSAAHGANHIGPLTLGITIGKLALLGGATAGVAALMPALGQSLVRYCGAAYLIWLGGRKWWQIGQALAGDDPFRPAGMLPQIGVGVAIAVSNPIALAFYLALLPAAIDLAHVRLLDYFLLGAIVVAVMATVATSYGLAGELMRRLWSEPAFKRRLDRSAERSS